MNQLVVLLGGNIGDKVTNFTKAIYLIEEKIGKVVEKSSLYESEPWGYEDVYQYLNAVIIVKTNLSAKESLRALLQIEVRLGRTRNQTKTYAARTIDLDILFFNQDLIDDKELKVPHPLLHERKFTLIPLKQLLPNYHHPVLKKTISYLCSECKDVSNVVEINNFY